MIDKNSDEGIAWYATWLDCWEAICNAFPNAKPDAHTSDVYADRLCDLAPALLRAAVEQTICTHRWGNWLPTIADIRAAARGLTEATRPSALEVWGTTMRELAESLREHRPAKLDPEVKVLVEALGGRKLLLDETKPGIARSQFIKAYERNSLETERLRSATPIATGIIAGQRALKAKNE